MKYPQLEEVLRKSKSDLTNAASENIIEQCQKYLVLIAKYREELYKFRGTPDINLQNSNLPAEEVISTRKNSSRSNKSYTGIRSYRVATEIVHDHKRL